MKQLLDFLNQALFSVSDFTFTLRHLILLISVILLTWLLRVAIRRTMRTIYENFKLSKENKLIINRFLNYLVVFIAGVVILLILGIDPVAQVLHVDLFKMPMSKDGATFQVANIFNVFTIYVFVRVLLWVIEQALSSYTERKNLDIGTRYAIQQVIKYIVYTMALLAAIQALGFDLGIIWGGAAALMVGIGLGLQQTFNDLLSGLLLLIERSVEVGDTLDVGGTVGRVERIGIRVSQIKTRDDIVVLVPNSHLVTSQVVNWTHNKTSTRFAVDVGVAYGSDTALVRRLLLEVANKHEEVESYPSPVVQFRNFGASSLDFKLFFWSKGVMEIERVKSDLRFEIDAAFRQHGIQIPFPQQDVWIRTQP